MSAIQIRTTPKLKKDVQRVLQSLGLDMSSAINLYLHQIVIQEGIPFPIRTVNGFTIEQEQKILREEKEALRNGKRYNSAKELHDAILKE